MSESSPQQPLGIPFWPRAGAYVIDTVIIYAVTLVTGFIGGLIYAVYMGLTDLRELNQQAATFYAIPIGFISSTLYFSLFEGLYGATPGKLIMRQRIVIEDGRPCGLGRALVRALLRSVDGLFFGAVAAINMKSPLRQRLGDKLAHTLVVDRRDALIQQHRPWGVLAIPILIFPIWAMISAVAPLAYTSRPILLVNQPAAQLNLITSELGPEWEMQNDDEQVNFNTASIRDGSRRLFRADQMLVESHIAVFPKKLIDTDADLRMAAKDTVQQDFPDQAMAFDKPVNAAVGDRGIAQMFSYKTMEGYVVMFIRRNVIVRLVLLGPADEVDMLIAQRYARIIDAHLGQ